MVMKLISWNINGLNSALCYSKDGHKGKAHIEENTIRSLIDEHNPDILCLQEVRCSVGPDLLERHFGGTFPYIYTNCSKTKKGYSGTAILSKTKPQHVYYDMEGVHPDDDLNDEGRIIRAQYKDFALINVYTPNSQDKGRRLEYRAGRWEPCFRDVVAHHRKNRDVIVCGDLNVAHNEIDIHSPKNNEGHAGFTQQERLAFGLLLHNLHMIDTFRTLHPTAVKYSWWSNFNKARENNKGWRIDYFVVSRTLAPRLLDADILTDFKGSDHAPVSLTLEP